LKSSIEEQNGSSVSNKYGGAHWLALPMAEIRERGGVSFASHPDQSTSFNLKLMTSSFDAAVLHRVDKYLTISSG
jgi:hypothetical protein